jgi:hypothetical protein
MAATYDFTPVNGGANAVATLETTAAIAMYKITVRSTSNGDNTAVDLSSNDGAHGSLYDLILREVAPLMAYADAGSNGTIHVVVDSHANSAATLAARLEAQDGIGTDTIVEAAASFAVTP